MTLQLPSLELIESMHTFPGPFTFKVIGDANDQFVADALTLAMSAVKDDREFSHSTRTSSAGNHLSLTLTMHVHNAKEVHSIYEKLLLLQGLRALF